MRRAVLVVGALVVLLLALRACGGGSGDAAERDAGTPTPSVSPSGTRAAADAGSDAAGAGEPADDPSAGANANDVVLDPGAVTASPSAGASGDPSGEPSAEPSATAGTDEAGEAAGGSACSDDDIEVAAKPDAASYGSGANPRLTLSVRNVSGSPCIRDLGSGALELVVESGPARIWSSDDCGAKAGKDERTLKAGESWSTSVTWSRKRSAPGCTGRADAADGTYVVTARVGSATSDSARFLLE